MDPRKDVKAENNLITLLNDYMPRMYQLYSEGKIDTRKELRKDVHYFTGIVPPEAETYDDLDPYAYSLDDDQKPNMEVIENITMRYKYVLE